MSRLTKDILSILTHAGTAGSPGTPAVPGHDGYWATTYVTTTVTEPVAPVPDPTGGSYGIDIPEGGLILGGVVTYSTTTGSWVNHFPPSGVGGCNQPHQEITPVQTWIPPSPGTPATPAIPPTPAQYALHYNVGWNSWAHSILHLERGKMFDFSCATGITGCMMAVGPMSKIGMPISQFSHALVGGTGGVKVSENGSIINSLSAGQHSLQKLRIYYQPDGRIVYTVVYDKDTSIYTGSFYVIPTAFIHAYLYTGGDQIMTSQYLVGDVKYGSV